MAESSAHVKKRGAGAEEGAGGNNVQQPMRTDDDDDDDGDDGSDKQSVPASKKPKRTSTESAGSSSGADSGAQLRLQELKRDKDDAKRNMEKAEHELDEAKAELVRLKAANASKEDMQRAQNSVDIARTAWTTAMDAHKSAMDAENKAYAAATGGGRSAREVKFAFEPDVLTRLRRPLSNWQAGETFDVTGFGEAVGSDQWHDMLYLRAEGLAVLREWESATPYLAMYGTPGIGKSTLLQLAALRALVLDNPVLLHVRGENTLIQMTDDTTLLVEDSLSLARVGLDGRRKRNTVMCFDSPNGFQVTVGRADVFKKAFIVHSPSGNLNNTRKADGVRSRLFPVPTEAELVALGDIKGIDADEVRRRVARYGPIIRFVFNAEAEKWIVAGIDAMVPRGPDGLLDFYNVQREVHRITLVLPKPTGVGEMHTFVSDYVRDEVLGRMAQTNAFGLLRLANNVDIHGSLRGQVFENRMLDALSRAGAKIAFKTDGVDKVLQIAATGITLVKIGSNLTLPAGETTFHQNVLYRPPHSNNASWDALLVESDQLAYLLQMTVASAHPVKQHGLTAGKALLESAGFAGDVRLVFLLPPAAFSGFRLPQAIHNGDGTTSALSTVDKWSQEKWHVDTVGGAAFWPQQQK